MHWKALPMVGRDEFSQLPLHHLYVYSKTTTKGWITVWFLAIPGWIEWSTLISQFKIFFLYLGIIFGVRGRSLKVRKLENFFIEQRKGTIEFNIGNFLKFGCPLPIVAYAWFTPHDEFPSKNDRNYFYQNWNIGISGWHWEMRRRRLIRAWRGITNQNRLKQTK